MKRTWNMDALPERWRETMARYLDAGCDPGSFLTAVLANDLTQAFRRADKVSAAELPQIVAWIAANVPQQATGSGQNVAAWMRQQKAASLAEAVCDECGHPVRYHGDGYCDVDTGDKPMPTRDRGTVLTGTICGCTAHSTNFDVEAA